MPGSENTVDLQRRAGVLLHPTSLPGNLYKGNIGHDAYRFIEFLSANHFKVWQMLPLGPTHEDDSPYQCLSAHAGNTELISLDWLIDRGWLVVEDISVGNGTREYLCACLLQAGKNFYKSEEKDWRNKFDEFIKEHASWIEDYALFIVIKKQNKNLPWYKWDKPFRTRKKAALDKIRTEYKQEIRQVYFEQFIFFTQWHELKAYANQHNVELFGDMPIFVSHDSADVWARRENFLINEDGDMPVVAGVPPDAFSDTGQRWGNPVYNWKYMQTNNFDWWKDRFKTQLELFDLVRIDHFRGLEACWEIPSEDEVAINGKWVKVPGKELLVELFNTFENLPLVAEDLGVITDEVIELKNNFNLPGMKVLQFAFDGNPHNPHLPHNHMPVDVIYTGTHDNDTTAGWAKTTENYNLDFFDSYTGIKHTSIEQKVMTMIRTALSSVSFLCVIPLQDIFMLDGAARMNTPGTTENNWKWRFDWAQVIPDVLDEIRQMVIIYER